MKLTEKRMREILDMPNNYGLEIQEIKFRDRFNADLECSWANTEESIRDECYPGWREDDDIPEAFRDDFIDNIDFEMEYWGFMHDLSDLEEQFL